MHGGTDAEHTGREPDTRATHDRNDHDKAASRGWGRVKQEQEHRRQQQPRRAHELRTKPTRNELEMFGTCWFWYVHIARSGIGAKVS